MLIVLFTERVAEDVGPTRWWCDEWVTLFNKNLSAQSSRSTIVGWFGSQQNLVLNTNQETVKHSLATFASCDGLKCVGFTVSELYWLIYRILVRDRVDTGPHRNKSIGVAFQLHGPRHNFDDFETDRASFRCLDRGIAAVTRRESSIAQRRHGKGPIPWPKVSEILGSKLRGKWTSRNIDLVEGVFRRALQCLDTRKLNGEG